MPSSLVDDETAWQAAGALLCEPLLAVERQRGGRNNRLHCVTTSRGTRYALKQYPCNLSDTRDRLNAEFEALTFLGECGLGEVPRALGAAREGGFALYEWIDGSPITAPTSEDIDAALRFLSLLHDHRNAPASSRLRLASEACLSPMDIVCQVDRRLERLADAAKSQPELRTFLDDELLPLWNAVSQWSRACYQVQGMSFTAPLAREHRTLSPSDFGFHNALRRTDGRVAFVDFEYFGWDDPVKLVSDFLQHPGMTLSADLQAQFNRGTMILYGEDETFRTRLELLYPLFGLRWCAILLNEFLPERWQSRIFAEAGLDRAAVTRAQLEKARRCLSAARAYWTNHGGS